MNNEFDNNQPSESAGSNSEYENNNIEDSNMQIIEITATDNSSSDNSSSDNSNSDNINQDNNTYSNVMNNLYQNQAVHVEDKPTKKKKKFGFIKVTAAALAFGLIAGVAFQGYYTLTNPVTASKDQKDDNNLKAEEVAETSGNGDTIVPTASTTQGVVSDVSDVVAKVLPSIVAINSTANVTSSDFFGRQFTQQVDASGSGIIIQQTDSELLIVTNNHVIDGSKTAEVVFSDNSKATAEIKSGDANSDLAVLSVKLSDLSAETASTIKVATIGNSDDVKPGEMVIAIGNALGYGQSVTVGYISALNREVTIGDQTQKLLQTDAAINPGNSGGALLNASGQLIGINSEKVADTSVEGMGYAIPISNAIPMINELINRQSIAAGQQGYLGIDASTAKDVTDEYAQRFNMPVGVYVNDVLKGSPAEAAGLKQGDIITGLDDNTIKTIDDLVNVISYKKEGQKINLKIQTKENGSYVEKTLEITLGKK